VSSPLKWDEPFSTGCDGKPFDIQLDDENGVGRTDVSSCAFKLFRKSDPTGTPLIDEDCNVIDATGRCAYEPDVLDMTISGITYDRPLRVLGEFVATLNTGKILPAQYVEGMIIKTL
jgi:hypothetical protein